MTKRSKKLRAYTLPVQQLQARDRNEMFQIFHTYYAQAEFCQFCRDLQNKDVVIILRDKTTGDLKGFSTIVGLQITVQGKTVFGAFSGDTIVDREYWGQSALQRAFLKYLWWQKCKHPFSPYYWFLISKGYKTYLLMANNFREYYPRYDQRCPADREQILTGFARILYRDLYDAATGLIKFPEVNTHLHANVAPIETELIEQNPKVSFFIKKNPTWQQGTELACIARMTWTMPLRYALRYLWKNWRRK